MCSGCFHFCSVCVGVSQRSLYLDIRYCMQPHDRLLLVITLFSRVTEGQTVPTVSTVQQWCCTHHTTHDKEGPQGHQPSTQSTCNSEREQAEEQLRHNNNNLHAVHKRALRSLGTDTAAYRELSIRTNKPTLDHRSAHERVTQPATCTKIS